MKFILFFIACSLIFACSANQEKSNNNERGYYPTYTKDLEDTLRTLDLTYIAFACQCANWDIEAGMQKNQNQEEKLEDRTIFIEPIDSLVELPDTLGYSADLIRFTGRFYKDKGYPKKYPVTEMQVDKARVFQYTKFEVLRSNYRGIMDFINDSTTTK